MFNVVGLMNSRRFGLFHLVALEFNFWINLEWTDQDHIGLELWLYCFY